MEGATTITASAWEALRTACSDAPEDSPTRALSALLQGGFVALADVDLEMAERTACSDGSKPPRIDGPDQTDYLRWLLDKLCTMSMEDGLTGLFNRRYFDHRVRQEVQRATRDKRACSIMLVDADHFKSINDTYGHAGGDAVLQSLGQVLRDALRTTDDVTTRFGGEEFAVILPGTDARGAMIAGERLRSAVEGHPFEANGTPITVTVSVGVATYDPSWAAITVDALLEGADDALYKAKEAGRNRVRSLGQVSIPADEGVTNAEKDALF